MLWSAACTSRQMSFGPPGVISSSMMSRSSQERSSPRPGCPDRRRAWRARTARCSRDLLRRRVVHVVRLVADGPVLHRAAVRSAVHGGHEAGGDARRERAVVIRHLQDRLDAVRAQVVDHRQVLSRADAVVPVLVDGLAAVAHRLRRRSRAPPPAGRARRDVGRTAQEELQIAALCASRSDSGIHAFWPKNRARSAHRRPAASRWRTRRTPSRGFPPTLTAT